MDEDSEARINSFKNKQGSSPDPLPGLFKIHRAQGRGYDPIKPHLAPFEMFMKQNGTSAAQDLRPCHWKARRTAVAWMDFVLGAQDCLRIPVPDMLCQALLRVAGWEARGESSAL